MLIGADFINDSINRKALKIITRTVDFGIPTLKTILFKTYLDVVIFLLFRVENKCIILDRGGD